jgi:membrane associated rhomboid family serine protease
MSAPTCEARRAPPAADEPTRQPWWRAAPACSLVVAATLAVFAFERALPLFAPQVGTEAWLWNTPPLVTQRLFVWQVLTASFVHAGPLHLGVNLFFVIWLGPRLEASLGSLRFGLFYLAAGVFAYAFYDLSAHALGDARTTGGASANVLALVTLHVLRFPDYVVPLYGVLRVPLGWILLLFVISDASSLLFEGETAWVNNLVHLGGIAFALACWSLLLRRRTAR